jgi:hypothetical protein
VEIPVLGVGSPVVNDSSLPAPVLLSKQNKPGLPKTANQLKEEPHGAYGTHATDSEQLYLQQQAPIRDKA